ncbi:MAG TPA: transcription antitermination factor NusB [Gaiellales bacterium]|nr:transcription antitermination factor NusB [Gaiellales bacterium]
MTARDLAYEVIRRTFEEGAYTDRAFAGEAAKAVLDDRDRRLAMRLAYGTVQRVRTLDHAFAELAGRPVARMQPPLRTALRMGAYQLLFAGGVPDHAAVSETVDLARRVAGAGAAGFANALLRRVAAAGSDWVATLPPALRHSYPDWVADEWTEMFGAAEAELLMAAQNEPAELAVRVNPLAAGPFDPGVPWHGDPELPEAVVLDGRFDVAASEQLAAGLIWPQSRAAMLPARLLAPEPGMRVADLCAAPGGKSGQLAALMGNRGELVCVDSHRGRAAALRRMLRGQHVTCAEVVVADVLDVRRGGFDRILLDPPCSGLGVLAGRPDARWRRTPESAADLAGLQARLLDHALGMLAPGGRLVYAVCTLRRAECGAILPGGRFTLPHVDHTDGFYIAAP